jgi:prepilin-type processing-associated H-X9-DG protein
LVQPYAKNEQIFVCPTGKPWPASGGCGFDPAGAPCGPAVGGIHGSYSINYLLFDPLWHASIYVRGGKALHPAQLAWYYDAYGPAGDPSSAGDTSQNWCHNEGMNIAFYDGHAKWFSKGSSQYSAAIWRNQ